jgi:hypothetical protein
MPTALTGQQHDPAHARPASARAPRLTAVLVLALLASLVFVVAAVLTLAPALPTDQARTQTRADAAWTARLEGLTVHAEAQRQARADAAWTARLEGLAGEERS